MNGNDESGLIVAYRLDGQGGGQPCDWAAIRAHQAGDGLLWVHLHRDADESQAWLREESALDPLVVESLLAESTRPHCSQVAGGVMLFLRAVNLNPGADPDDMVSIRLWIEPGRVISVRRRRLLSVDDMRVAIDEGRGPHDVADFVIQLARRIGARMAGVIGDIDDHVDALQGEVIESGSVTLRSKLTGLRRDIIALRRYLAPQRDALLRFTQLKLAWFEEMDHLRLREEADRITRYVEDLDAARERAAVAQEELSNRLTEQMNARMYVLSVVAAVFLPLGFLTGLFGINVGGIPLADDPWGFFEIVLLLCVITGLQLLLFKWRRWF